MKLNHPAKRLTAALLSGAMLFTLSAPALAADPGAAPDAAPAAAAPLNEENSSEEAYFSLDNGTTKQYFTRADFSATGVTYDSSTQTLTFTGSYSSLTIDAPGVNVKITGSPDQTLVGEQGDSNSLVLKITNSASVYISNLQDGVTSGAQAIAGTAEIISDGAVTIYGTDRAVGGEKLTVNAGGDVEIANNHACAAIWKDADITSGGSVTIGSKADGGWVIDGELKYTNTSAQETVLRQDGVFPRAVASGKSTTPSLTNVKKFTVAPEEKVALNLTNCYATSHTSSDHRNSFYAGEPVYVYPDRPTNGVSFQKWVYPETLDVTSSSDSDYISFTMPAEPVNITAVWNMYNETSQKLHIQWNDESVDLTPDSFTDDDATVTVGDALSVTYADNIYTVAINDSSSRGSLNITGYTGQDGKQPSVVFVGNGAKLTSLNVKGSKNFTAESNSSKAIDCSGDVIIDCGGDVTISSTGGKAINCTKNVKITSTGDVNITSTGSAIESREASITSGGDVTITSSGGNAISCYGAATINCSGNVTVNSSSATDYAVDGNALIIENAQDVTITAQKAIFHGYINSSAGFTAPPAVRITCSGEVVLESAGDTLLEGLLPIFPNPDSSLPAVTLTYSHTNNNYTYEVWADNALLTDVGEAGTSFTLREDTTYSSIHIIPAAPIIPIEPGDDGGEGGDGAGIAGAVVAGVAIGGAAAWGSYEIATRVILNDLLPEGAAIPANRGQLALLVWNTAGRPAPAAVPAFADVTDPDTATAAQWCVEQGLLDTKDGKFDPDAYTAKFRVIEVWNKAFPKQ